MKKLWGKNKMADCGLCSTYHEDYRMVFRNEDAVSVVITNPLNAGHLMITPRRHVLGLDDLTANESKAVHDILYRSQQRLLKKFPEQPPILAMQTGRHSTQPHIHYQMFPSDTHIRVLYAAAHDENGKLSWTIDKNRTNPAYTREKLEEMARNLR